MTHASVVPKLREHSNKGAAMINYLRVIAFNISIGMLALSCSAQALNMTNREIDDELFQAIRENANNSYIQELLHKGADPDADSNWDGRGIQAGQPIWLYALLYSKPETIVLLKNGRKSGKPMAPGFQARAFQMAMSITQDNNPSYALDRIKLLISSGLDVNAINLEDLTNKPHRGGDDQSPLMYAAASGKVDIAKLLLDKGADVNLKDKKGKTALSFAKDGGVAQLLIRAGADTNAKDRYGNTSLNEAIINGRSDVVAAILSSSSKTSKDTLNLGLLAASRVTRQTTYKGAHETSASIVEMLLKNGADPNFAPPKGEGRGAPLLEAVYTSNAPAVKLLLAAGADPKRALNSNGGSLMALALTQEDPEIIKLLWPLYQPISEELYKEWVQIAGLYGKAESVRMLTSLGFKLTTNSKEAVEALYRAVDRGDLATVSLLLEQGANPNQEVFGNQIILSQAIHQGNIEIVRLLIAKGAKINVVSNSHGDDTPLRAAISTANLEIFNLLRDKGAKLSSDKPEDSPLHALPWLGGYYGQKTEAEYLANVMTILDELLKAQNPIDAPDYQGQSLLAKAAAQGFAQLVKKIISSGADVNFLPTACKKITPSKLPVEPIAQKGDAGTSTGIAERIAISPEQILAGICITPLQGAVMANNMENAKLLIAAKANINLASPYSGLTPLMMAAMNGNPQLVTLLLESGADAKMKNFAGQTAAEIAKIRENSRAQSLIEKALQANK